MLTIGPGDAYEIPPGHDAWVVGDEPWDSVEFASAHAFGLSPEELGERVLATILFSDIVDSTATLERLGDHAWAELLREHNVRIRAAIDRFRGREIDAAGDGFLALFDGAAKAVSAAASMDPAVADLGIRVRVGIHTSEVEIVGGQARGVGGPRCRARRRARRRRRGVRLRHHPRPARRLGPRRSTRAASTSSRVCAARARSSRCGANARSRDPEAPHLLVSRTSTTRALGWREVDDGVGRADCS